MMVTSVQMCEWKTIGRIQKLQPSSRNWCSIEAACEADWKSFAIDSAADVVYIMNC